MREVDAYDLLSALLDEADREGYYSEEDRSYGLFALARTEREGGGLPHPL